MKMMRLGWIVGVIALAGLGWLSQGQAAVAANTTLNIDITVTVPNTVRIEWSTGTDLAPAAPGNTATGVWALGNQDFGASVLLSASNVLTLKNAGNARVDISAKMNDYGAGVTDNSAATQKWAVGDPAGMDIYAILLTPTGGGAATKTARQLLAADQAIVEDYRRTYADVNLEIQYDVPTDSAATGADAGLQHGHRIVLTAAAG